MHAFLRFPGAVLLSVMLGSCFSVPTHDVPRETMRGFERLEYQVDVGVDERDMRSVSALSVNGDANATETLVLYLHGTPGDAEAWAAYLADPVGSSRAVAVDRPGFGKSDHRALATLRGQSRALEPFLHSAREVVVVGHSYGGPVALQAALDYPERVVGVVAIAASVSPAMEKRRWFNYLAAAFRLVLPRSLRRANDEVWPLRQDLERLARELGKVRVPVRIVHGTEDSLVPYANVPFMQESLTGSPSVEVTRIEAAGHFIIWEEAHVPTVRAVIASLLERHRNAQSGT